MTTPATEAEIRLKTITWWTTAVGILLLAITVWVPVTQRYTNVDTYVFGTAARRLLAGQRLYTDFTEAKPPLMTLTYAIPGLLLPGQEKSGNGMGVLLVLTLLAQTALWLYYLRQPLMTSLTVALFLIIYPNGYPDFAWPSSEHFSNLFISLILIFSWIARRDGLLTDGRMFVMGAATCIAFHYRQNCLLAGAVPLWVVLTSGQTIRAKLRWSGWFVAGGLATWAVILVAVCFVSNLSDYFSQVFIFPRKFAAYGGDFQSRTHSFFQQVATATEVRLTYVFFLAFILALCRKAKGFVIFSALIGVGYCIISPRPHEHYLINTFPFITLFFFIGLEGKASSVRFKEWLSVACVAVVVFVNYARAFWVSSAPVEPMDEVVQAVNRAASADDTSYVSGTLGCEYIQLHADPLPGNKYSFGWEMDFNQGMMEEDTKTILDRFVQNPPTILVFDHALVEQIGYRPVENPWRPAYFYALARHLYPSDKSADGNSLQFVQLARLLLARHQYEEVWNNSNFFIFKLKNNPPNQLPADTIPANVPPVR